MSEKYSLLTRVFWSWPASSVLYNGGAIIQQYACTSYYTPLCGIVMNVMIVSVACIYPILWRCVQLHNDVSDLVVTVYYINHAYIVIKIIVGIIYLIYSVIVTCMCTWCQNSFFDWWVWTLCVLTQSCVSNANKHPINTLMSGTKPLVMVCLLVDLDHYFH